jgi:nucleoside-diphosphate-sugar epimerase
MKVFVTGASGWIGSATIAELLAAGHSVTGLARSDSAAEAVAAQGATVRRGSLADLGVLAEEAAAADGVVHLGYSHDFSKMAEAAQLDRDALATFGTALAGTGRPLAFASGVMGVAPGRVMTEQDRPEAGAHPRVGNAATALALAEQGVRPVSVRFAPTVHGQGDHGFTAVLAAVAREKGVAAYIGDGANHWPAVHRSDAARLVRLALEDAPAGSSVHAVAETGIPTREIAEALGRAIGVPTASIPAEQAAEHFGWIGMFFAADCLVSNDWTRSTFSWEPTGPTLVQDIESGYYPGSPNS